MAILLLSQLSPAHAITTSDCVAEQQALLQANIDEDIFPESRANLPADYIAKKEAEITQRTREEQIPWHITDTNKLDSADGGHKVIAYLAKEVEENLQVLASFDTRPWARMADDRFNPGVYRRNAAKASMQICQFSARIDELSGTRVAPPSEPSVAPKTPPLAKACPADEIEAADREMTGIESRAEAFLQSPAGRQNKSATPSLQVVMWATAEQIKVIDGHCRGAVPALADKRKQLQAAHDGAHDACMALAGDLGDWAPCGPAPPEQFLGRP